MLDEALIDTLRSAPPPGSTPASRAPRAPGCCSNRTPSAPEVHRPRPRQAPSPRAPRASASRSGSTLSTIPGPPPYGRSSTVRCTSCGVVARIVRTSISSTPALDARGPAHRAPTPREASHGNRAHHRDTHAFSISVGRVVPIDHAPAAPCRSTRRRCCGTAGTQYSRVHRAPPSGHAPEISMKCATAPSRIALEVHHLAADQIGPVEISLSSHTAAARSAPRATAAPLRAPAAASRSSMPASFTVKRAAAPTRPPRPQ